MYFEKGITPFLKYMRHPKDDNAKSTKNLTGTNGSAGDKPIADTICCAGQRAFSQPPPRTKNIATRVHLVTSRPGMRQCCHLTAADAKELATEMLLLRHRFTELVFNSRKFKQAALTVLQNIYLFRNRRIFFGTNSQTSYEEERQEALHLFSVNPCGMSIPLAKAFQHLILARI